MVAFNTATKANPFGLIAGAIVLALPLLDKFINKTDKAREALQKASEAKIGKVNAEIERLGEILRNNTAEAQQFANELAELAGVEMGVANKESVAVLEAQKKKIKENLDQHKNIQKQLIANLKVSREELSALEERKKATGSSLKLDEKIALAKEDVVSLEEALSASTKETARFQLDQFKNSKKLTEAQREAKDLAFARKVGIEKLLKEENKEVTLLNRKTAIIKAINESGLEGAKVLEKQFKVEDKIVELYKSGNISLEQAYNLANKIITASEDEKAVIAKTTQIEAERVKLNEEQRQEVEKRLIALKQEQALHQKNQEIAKQELAVLEAKSKWARESCEITTE